MMVLPVVAALLVSAGPVSLQFEGQLDEALRQVAKKGNLSLVMESGLDQEVQLDLSGVSAEEALESLCQVYGLELTRKGKLFVIRAHAGEAMPAPPPPGLQVTVGDDDGPDDEVDAAEEEAERIREEAEAARERAEAMKEQAEALAEARRDQLDAMREVAEAQAELARHRVSTGGPVRVESNSRVDTAVAYGGPVIVESNAVVEGDAVAFGGDVVLEDNAVVEGDAVAFAGTVVRAPTAVVKGETVSMGGSGLGSVISKSVVKSRKIRSDDGEHVSGGSSAGNRLAAFLLQFALFFGLGFALMMFAPQRMRALEAAIRAEPVKNGVAGLAGLVAAIPATVLLVVTLVGIPVAVLLWVALALFIPVGLAAIANTVGTAMPTGRLRKTQALVLAVGVLVLMALSVIPVVGPAILSLATFVSLGAIIRTRFGQPGRGLPIFESPRAAAPL